MSSQIRMSGMISGLDTESIISQLVSAKSTKVNTLRSEQTKLSWKQEIWKDFNSKIKSMVNGSLANLRFSDAYTKKTTESSNSDKVTVTTADTAMNTVQSLKINNLAASGYMTGAKLTTTSKGSVSSGTKLSDLGVETGSKINLSVGTGSSAKTTSIEITSGMTINSLITKLQSAGVEASFDSTNKRIFIGSKSSGSASDFNLTASDSTGWDALSKMGLLDRDNESALKSVQAAAALANESDERTNAISAQVAVLTKSYEAQKKTLEDSQSKLQEKLDKAAEDYKTNFTDDEADFDITDDDKRAAKIAELNEKKEAGTITEDEQKKLDALNAYDTDASTYSANAEKLDLIDKKLNNDSTLSSDETIEAEAAKYVDAQAKKAQALLDSWTSDSTTSNTAKKISGTDAKIELNGATFTSSSNTITVNGLTLSLKGTTTGDETISLTTKQDTSGIYDSIKNFFKEYNEIINKMDELYNADSASGYDVLTDDEKESMTETEIEKWETTIKDSLLRRDSTLNTASSAMEEIMADGYTVNGKTMYLSSFGINTLNYFLSGDNEKHAYHINGDEDDDDVKTETNTLQTMIETDPDTVVSFFTQLSKTLYDKMNSLMASSTYSSYATLYDDKKMASEYSDYKTKISEAEEKLNDYEDKWYSKFSSMETSLAKLQSNSSAVTSLLS